MTTFFILIYIKTNLPIFKKSELIIHHILRGKCNSYDIDQSKEKNEKIYKIIKITDINYY